VLLRDPNRTRSDDRRCALYVPNNYDGKKPVPLVLALHGWPQTERLVTDKSRLEEAAEREVFIVAYPYMLKARAGETNDEGGRNPRCWGFWFAEEIHRDRGEVSDIARLVDRVRSTHNIDPNRVHIIGI